MSYLIIAALAFYCGHFASPWIDGKMADLRERWDPDPSDDRNVDRNDWSLK